jgi:predicted nucleic acid-binding protein
LFVVVLDQAPQAHAQRWRATVEGREPTADRWTDAWLAALAQTSDCEMTTFDKGFRSFARLEPHLLSAAV